MVATKQPPAPDKSLVPAYLQDMLDLEKEMGALDEIYEAEVRRVDIRRIEIPQRTSTAHMGHVGEIALVKGSGEAMEVEYVKTMKVLLIDYLYFDKMNAEEWMEQDPKVNRLLSSGIGGRTMWSFNESGARNTEERAPVCSTNNGFNPWPSYRDKDIADYRTGQTNRIGQRFNENTGAWEEADNACIGCLFAQWVNPKESKDGKKHQPMCRPTPEYVFWDVERRELFRMKAVNVGTDLALGGIGANKNGSRFDGGEFPGIKWYFGFTGELINDDGEKITGLQYKNLPPEQRSAYRQVFRNRPQGKPTSKKWDVPVYPVQMSVTLNNFTNPSLAPQFAIMDGNADPQVWFDKKTRFPVPAAPLTGEEYAAYLTDMLQTYGNGDYRNIMLASNLIVRNDRPASLPEVPQNASLPASTGTPALAPKPAADNDSPFPV